MGGERRGVAAEIEADCRALKSVDVVLPAGTVPPLFGTTLCAIFIGPPAQDVGEGGFGVTSASCRRDSGRGSPHHVRDRDPDRIVTPSLRPAAGVPTQSVW